MDTISFNTHRFSSTEQQNELVLTWRKKYGEVTELLGRLGSQVLIWRTIERDQDIAPHQFVRNAIHEFVFPPQEVTVARDQSGVIDPNLDYNLVEKHVISAYDPALVRGHLRVRYDDADSRISFEVSDVLGDSQLPKKVEGALAVLRAETPCVS